MEPLKDAAVNSHRAHLPGDPASASTNLLAGLKARESDAWRRFIRLFGPVVYGWCRRMGLRAEDAADASQEVFRAVVQHVDRFRREKPGDTFRGWLWCITRHKLIDHYRSRALRPEAAGGTDCLNRLMQLESCVESDSSLVDDLSDRAVLLRRALFIIRPHFEERTWEAFWRTAVDQHPVPDVAAQLGMTAGAVYVSKSRVLRRLRDELGDLIS